MHGRWKNGGTWLGLLMGIMLGLWLSGCTSPPSSEYGKAQSHADGVRQHVLVLPYEAFGPSAMSNALVGMPWWQWQATGGSDPRARFDIRVAVYDEQHVSLETVRQLYPIIPEKQQDYRYVSRTRALRYLNRQLKALAEMPAEEQRMFASLRQRLLETRQRIMRFFAGGAAEKGADSDSSEKPQTGR